MKSKLANKILSKTSEHIKNDVDEYVSKFILCRPNVPKDMVCNPVHFVDFNGKCVDCGTKGF